MEEVGSEVAKEIELFWTSTVKKSTFLLLWFSAYGSFPVSVIVQMRFCFHALEGGGEDRGKGWAVFFLFLLMMKMLKTRMVVKTKEQAMNMADSINTPDRMPS